jgi:hypothetical protein
VKRQKAKRPAAPPRAQRRSSRKVEGECIIPTPLPPDALSSLVLNRHPLEEDPIRRYVESRAPDERVVHLEKVRTERVFEREHQAWDLWTDQRRYWVITGPTNLYYQEHFPSVDVALSFHIGLMTRVLAREKVPAEDEPRQRLAGAWRRWIQASEALEQADEAEQFQAVGIQCRECLLEFVRVVADDRMVPEGQEPPKRGDFVHWAELIADTIARGDSADRVRHYLKTTAEATWRVVNWLTHSTSVSRPDGRLAVDATMNVLAAFGDALVRHERGIPDRCPKCRSYRLTRVYRPDLEIDPPYVTVCEKCGWGKPEEPQSEGRHAKHRRRRV